ncbi:MAG: helix-turn-helix transcriptional regulator [Rhizobiales bacterium]|nr:helix-turn-helix transcriptional regulator [Hyphomicrobiales bacterium]
MSTEPDISKRQTVAVFQRRLAELIAGTGRSQARFAARAGLDRSTLSQLLAEQNVRLPRAETIARIAQRHGASVDWLLGISEMREVTPDVVSQTAVSPGADDPANEHLKHWHEEARGSKLRYVPSSLPDQVKTEAVIVHENGKSSLGEAAAAAAEARRRIDHARAAASEIEVCSTRQSVEALARGEGLWRHLPLRERRRQLEHMAGLVENLYPAYRWFLFDGRERFAAPYTVFGQARAAVYMGGFYFVFTSTEHIRQLTQHFDDLIRHAVVQPNETAGFIRRLMKDLT